MKLKDNRIRLNLLLVLFVVLFFVAVFLKLVYVGINKRVEGINLQELAASRSTVTKKIHANRGNIYDNSGNLLAQNMNSYTVIAYLSSTRTVDDRYPKHVVDKDYTARQLATVLEPLNPVMTYEYILNLLSQNLYQVELGPGGRNISEYTKEKIEKLTLPGIDFTKTTKRYYQNGDFASYIIGYAKKYEDEETGETDTIGELGIEGYCDEFLRGKDGTITYSKDAYGYQMANSVSYTDPAEDGYDVYLTIDKQIQIFIDNAVNMINQKGATWITFTVADAKTGAIVGSSSNPSFNPNKLNITNYNNPLTSYAFEPGSTMKIFSFMSAIEEGKYNGNATYKSGTITVGDYTIKDWNTYGWGTISYDVGFTYSSNIAAANLALSYGKKKLLNYYSDLGFGSLTGIELANESKGDIDINYEIEVATAAYGHGITVTPIQMIQALTTLTNDGTVIKPYVIDKIVDPNNGNKVLYQGKRTEIKKVYSTSTINKMIDLMDLTVNGTDKVATGRVYATPAVRLIGKTGTANYIGSNGEYITGSVNVIRSFAGVFPKEQPQYIIYLVVKDFQGTNKNIGAIAKSLVESIAKYRNIDETISTQKDASKIITVNNFLNKTVLTTENKINSLGATPIIIGDGTRIISQYPSANTKVAKTTRLFFLTNGTNYTMPDMKGWSSNDVISFCNLIGLKYNLNGYGYVVSTNIETNAIINLDATLEVNLKNIEPSSLALPKTQEGETNDNKQKET